jgi:hypothetical protein
MKLSENLKHEIKLHWLWFRSLWMGAIFLTLCFNFLSAFEGIPLGAMVFLGLVCAVGHYLWFRQGLSPDKKTFTPRIW